MPTLHNPDPRRLGNLFSRTIDAAPVRFVRPADTDRPTWVAYDSTGYLGTLHAQLDLDGRWHVQSLGERHLDLDDAIRALRRPASWPAAQAQARRWARAMLKDPRLVVLDIQTTGLDDAWAVQIGLTDRSGNVLLDELVNPMADVTAPAAALHGFSSDQLATAPTFGALVPELVRNLTGRRCLAYNADFDRGVLEREIARLPVSTRHSRTVLEACSWHDAMAPYATWRGLWSARRNAFRYQRLGSTYDAVSNCHRLLETVELMAH